MICLSCSCLNLSTPFLKTYQISDFQIADYVKSGHYQLACGRYFEVTHASKLGPDETDGFSPNHPNQYFEESQKLIHGDKKGKVLSRDKVGCYFLVT